MKYSKHALSLLIASPLTAYAHGEEVLVTAFLEFIVVLVFVVGLLTIKLNWKGKAMLGGIYVLAVVFTFIVANSLPYRQYETMINVLVVAVPLTIGVIGYIVLKASLKRNDR